MKTILIDASRDAYAPDDVRRTMTLSELIEYLDDLMNNQQIDGNTPIYLSHDRGYTYGGITESCFEGGFGNSGTKRVAIEELYYDEEELEREFEE